MTNRGLSELMLAVVEWAQAQGADRLYEKPGLWEADTDAGELGSLHVKLNAHDTDTDGVPPFSAMITSDRFVAACVCNPYGGTLAGFDEDVLIGHFRGQK